MGVCNCSMFCCTLLYVNPSIAIILMGKRELIALLNLSSWCLVMVERLFLAVPRGFLQFVIVVFPDHTHLLFLMDVRILFSTQYLYNMAFFELFPQSFQSTIYIYAIIAVKYLSTFAGPLAYCKHTCQARFTTPPSSHLIYFIVLFPFY